VELSLKIGGGPWSDHNPCTARGKSFRVSIRVTGWWCQRKRNGENSTAQIACRRASEYCIQGRDQAPSNPAWSRRHQLSGMAPAKFTPH